jgi:DNA-directed RNA polymerase specialized sigma24 family protein
VQVGSTIVWYDLPTSHCLPAIGEEVRDAARPKSGSKRNWELTADAFRQLLEWLDEGTDSAGARYLEIRRRLVSFFDRKNCLATEDLADETLNRVARRLKEEGAITNTTPAHYLYIVARFVFLEYLRRSESDPMSLDSGSQLAIPSVKFGPNLDFQVSREDRDKLLDCLELCLDRLEPENRELILRYYLGEQRSKIENRRALAERLGLTMNALSIRACRVRSRLQGCVSKCSDRGA